MLGVSFLGINNWFKTFKMVLLFLVSSTGLSVPTPVGLSKIPYILPIMSMAFLNVGEPSLTRVNPWCKNGYPFLQANVHLSYQCLHPFSSTHHFTCE